MRSHMTYRVFSINRVATTNASSGPTTTGRRSRLIISPIRPALAVRAVSGHMSGISANAADNIGGEVTLLWTIVLSMSDLTT